MVSQSMGLKEGEPVLKGLGLPYKSAFIPLSLPQEAPKPSCLGPKGCCSAAQLAQKCARMGGWPCLPSERRHHHPGGDETCGKQV